LKKVSGIAEDNFPIGKKPSGKCGKRMKNEITVLDPVIVEYDTYITGFRF